MAQEFAVFFAFVLKDARPGVGRHALEHSAKDFLGAIAPMVDGQTGVAPTGGAVAAHIIDRAAGRFGAVGVGGLRAERRQGGADAMARPYTGPCRDPEDGVFRLAIE